VARLVPLIQVNVIGLDVLLQAESGLYRCSFEPIVATGQRH
jgi:hypothetical protein